LKDLLTIDEVKNNLHAATKIRQVVDDAEMVQSKDMAGLRNMLNSVKDNAQLTALVARTLNQLR
jgi:hypothetical protein